ncbi:pre-mRNA processing RNA-helicase [Dimargaris cristalligena]|nr:pre-mRNA processing RNA-helicase [Dimargaris cristalligena]
MTSTTSDAAEKIRLRRERLEKWRKERESKNQAKEGTATPPPTTVAEPSPIGAPASSPATLGKPGLAAGPSTSLRLGFKARSKAVRPLAAFKASDSDDNNDSHQGKRKKIRLVELPPVEPDTDQGETNLSPDMSGESGATSANIETPAIDGPGEDSLDMFMVDVNDEVKKIQAEDQVRQDLGSARDNTPVSIADSSAPVSSLAEAAALDSDLEEPEESGAQSAEDILAMAAKRIKKKDLAIVDHNAVHYEAFQKDFFIEPAELRDLTPEAVDAIRSELDDIKIRGVQCPKPVRKWTQFGLPARCTEIIKKLNFAAPTPIQAQAVPAILSGRDIIGVAKTGSGKTLAFLLPMFRHIKSQRPLESGEGPIALIMTPTRELAVQIHRECKWFAKALGLRALCAYGGSPIKENIAELKRGAEVVVCTPGRLIDLLCANAGRLTSLARVTYLVLDEADRMFDMGFEPQVMRIVNNVRPDRQTVLFSATFPRQMEALARKILRRPLEITVGGRSVVCSDVTQHVEVLDDERAKSFRLLEILGRAFADDSLQTRCLIFVDRQDAADQLLRELMRRGYPCMSLHGGKDQVDRDSAITDFKQGVTRILIATSVAARGLDVKNLNYVINYDCPNHLEDYVHRVGRTGRAGHQGDAYTFLTPNQERYAVDIVKALKQSNAPIPVPVQALADRFRQKVETGEAHFSGSGFGGKGLEKLDKDRDKIKQLQKKAYGANDDDDDDDDDVAAADANSGDRSDGEQGSGGAFTSGETAIRQTSRTISAKSANGPAGATATPPVNAALEAARKAAALVAAQAVTSAGPGVDGPSKSRDILAEINAQLEVAAQRPGAGTAHGGTQSMPSDHAATADPATNTEETAHPLFSFEIEINDFPQKARWRVTNKDQIDQITELTGAAITTRGTFFPPGKQPPNGSDERKLYLYIESHQQQAVEKARTEIRRILADTTVQVMESEARGGGGGGGGGGGMGGSGHGTSGEATGRYTVL